MIAALSSSASELTVPQRIWHGLLGGTAYKRLAGDSARVYPSFLLVAACASLTVSVVVAVAASRGLGAVATAWTQLPGFSIVNGTLVLAQHVAPPVRVVADGAFADVMAEPEVRQAYLGVR